MKQYWKVYCGKIWNIIVLYNLMLLILTRWKYGSCGPLIYIKNYIKINSKEFQTLTRATRSNAYRSEDRSQYLIIEDCHNVTCTMSTIKKNCIINICNIGHV